MEPNRTIYEEEKVPLYKPLLVLLLIITVPIALVYFIFGLPGLKFLLNVIICICAYFAFFDCFFRRVEGGGRCVIFFISIIVSALCFEGIELIDKKMEKDENTEEISEILNIPDTDKGIDKLSLFLIDYPSTKYKEEILQRIYNVDGAKSIDKLETIYFYVKDNHILDMITHKVDSLYRVADTQNTIQAWEEYREKVPKTYWMDSEGKIELIKRKLGSTGSENKK